MPNDKKEWTDTAGSYGGNPVIWIDQASDPGLQAANSNGVCFAITRDWVRAYRRARIDRANFVNAFRDVQRAIPPQNLPAVYIERQETYAAQLKAQRNSYATIARLLPTASDTKSPTKAELTALFNSLRTHEYGTDVQSVTPYKQSLAFDIDDVVAEIRKVGNATPSYFMLSFSKSGSGGHVVGLECRPDKSAGSFPKIYEFIDANLGLYVFPSFDDMANFFSAVWISLYAAKNYDRYVVAQYGIGQGGFG